MTCRPYQKQEKTGNEDWITLCAQKVNSTIQHPGYTNYMKASICPVVAYFFIQRWKNTPSRQKTFCNTVWATWKALGLWGLFLHPPLKILHKSPKMKWNMCASGPQDGFSLHQVWGLSSTFLSSMFLCSSICSNQSGKAKTNNSPSDKKESLLHWKQLTTDWTSNIIKWYIIESKGIIKTYIHT